MLMLVVIDHLQPLAVPLILVPRRCCRRVVWLRCFIATSESFNYYEHDTATETSTKAGRIGEQVQLKWGWSWCTVTRNCSSFLSFMRRQPLNDVYRDCCFVSLPWFVGCNRQLKVNRLKRVISSYVDNNRVVAEGSGVIYRNRGYVSPAEGH